MKAVRYITRSDFAGPIVVSDNIHDAIQAGQRSVYAGPVNTARAMEALRNGQEATWTYGFCTVTITPEPDERAPDPIPCDRDGDGFSVADHD